MRGNVEHLRTGNMIDGMMMKVRIVTRELGPIKGRPTGLSSDRKGAFGRVRDGGGILGGGGGVEGRCCGRRKRGWLVRLMSGGIRGDCLVARERQGFDGVLSQRLRRNRGDLGRARDRVALVPYGFERLARRRRDRPGPVKTLLRAAAFETPGIGRRQPLK